jgi:hypothetical protein
MMRAPLVSADGVQIKYRGRSLYIPCEHLHLLIDRNYGLADLIGLYTTNRGNRKIISIATGELPQIRVNGSLTAHIPGPGEGISRFPARTRVTPITRDILHVILGIAEEYLGLDGAERILYSGPLEFISSGSGQDQ